METLEHFYKVTAHQEYEKNPKLINEDVQELLKWSDENINLHGKMFGEQAMLRLGKYIFYFISKLIIII